MGFGSSIKKAVKKATKQVVGGVKTFVSDPFSKEGLEAGIGLVATPATGGASLALTADAGDKSSKKAQQARSSGEGGQQSEDYQGKYGWGSLAELVEAKKKKEEEMAGRSQRRVSGIGSLIGGNQTLG